MRLIEHRWLDPAAVKNLPEFDAEARVATTAAFTSFLEEGREELAERMVLSLFHSHRLPEISSFRLLATLYREHDRPDRAAFWESQEIDKLFLRL